MITLLAHLTPTGYGPWGDGMARLLLQPSELLLVIALVLLAVACTAVLAATGLLVALGVRLRARVLLPLVALLAAAFALVGGSALGGHSGALPALQGETVAIAVLVTLLSQLLASPPIPADWRSPCGWAAAGSPPPPC